MIHALFTALAPWLLGAAVSLTLSLRLNKELWAHILAVPIGGYFGFIATAVVIIALDAAGISVFNRAVHYGFFCIVLLVVTACAFSVAVRFSASWRKKGITIGGPGSIVLVPVAATLLFFVMVHLSQPAQAWDALGHWLVKSVLFIRHSITGSEMADISNWNKHPMTLSIILASATWVPDLDFSPGAGLILWLVLGVSCFFLVVGFSLAVCNSSIVAVLAGLASLTIPLQENHVLLAGYAEIWMGVALMISVVTISLGLCVRSKLMILLGILAALTQVLLKNIGPVIAFVPIVALVLQYIVSFDSRRRFLLFSIAIFAIALTLLKLNAFDVEIFDQKIQYYKAHHLLEIFGRRMEISAPGANQILVVEMTSKIFNASFNLSILLLVLAVSAWFSGVDETDFKRSLAYVSSVIVLGLGLLLVSLFLDAGLNHAMPGLDTGHSRLSVIFFCLTPLLVPLIYHSSTTASEKRCASK